MLHNAICLCLFVLVRNYIYASKGVYKALPKVLKIPKSFDIIDRERPIKQEEHVDSFASPTIRSNFSNITEAQAQAQLSQPGRAKLPSLALVNFEVKKEQQPKVDLANTQAEVEATLKPIDAATRYFMEVTAEEAGPEKRIYPHRLGIYRYRLKKMDPAQRQRKARKVWEWQFTLGVVLSMLQGKTNKDTWKNYGVVVRNKDVQLCPVGALGFYLYVLWSEISDTARYLTRKAIMKAVNIKDKKKITHRDRVRESQHVQACRTTAEAIAQHGNWAASRATTHYLSRVDATVAL
ncbi:hypothetical protein BGZ80_007567 [Entomortierella chlamydospora]|uniref:Uncharacterized protein n=1 Tax=Entomortierella chlamydospora TaxID=101097 RepID=A0A9P6N3I3_9FUNG|nr:hypothetical protein BGZ80_007567 [Entomortierella chlamydospora]